MLYVLIECRKNKTKIKSDKITPKNSEERYFIIIIIVIIIILIILLILLC